ncbi:unnamed protein product, partial [Iphiclides podalirius]
MADPPGPPRVGCRDTNHNRGTLAVRVVYSSYLERPPATSPPNGGPGVYIEIPRRIVMYARCGVGAVTSMQFVALLASYLVFRRRFRLNKTYTARGGKVTDIDIRYPAIGQGTSCGDPDIVGPLAPTRRILRDFYHNTSRH